MELPKQPAQIDKERQALAPYNFVELPDEVATIVDGQITDREEAAKSVSQLPDQNVFHASRHSGWIDCRLTTESPTYVRAGRTQEQADRGVDSKDIPEFFYVADKDEPAIPASTLRGLLRSMVEIASFGKVSQVSDSRLVYRAIGKETTHEKRYRDLLMTDEGNHQYTPKVLGGYMRKTASDDWFIQPARNIGGTTFARIRINERLFDRLTPIPNCRNAYRVHVKVGPYESLPVRGGFLRVRATRVLEAYAGPTPDCIEATLARSGYMYSKLTEAVIYPPDENAKECMLTDKQIDLYRSQLSVKQKEILGERGVLADGQPVFYTLNRSREVEFFGHCRMLRMPYPTSPKYYVPEDLQRETDIDMAEAIFGFTKELKGKRKGEYHKKEKQYAGRVMISDARLIAGQENLWFASNRTIIPKVLASPKPTTFQHYLVQTQPNKVQIGKTTSGESKYEVRLEDYASTRSETVIRGHKLYWHKGPVKLSDIELNEKVKDTVLTKIQPLRAGVEFEFRIRFDNLSREELGAILWVLQLAADNRYRFKLGMGKPLGMGAVKIVSSLQLIDRAARYKDLFDSEERKGWATGLKPETEAREAQQEAVAAFERFVLDKVKILGARRLEELERIKQLLAMLSWPGPDPEKTRYLEIERSDPKAKRGKRNEYDGRPVLPNPLGVLYEQKKQTQPQGQQKSSKPAASVSVLPEGFKRGKVKSFGLGPKASFGFIAPDGGGADVFVHLNALPAGCDWLEIGQAVIYKERKGQRGLEAFEVRLEA